MLPNPARGPWKIFEPEPPARENRERRYQRQVQSWSKTGGVTGLAQGPISAGFVSDLPRCRTDLRWWRRMFQRDDGQHPKGPRTLGQRAGAPVLAGSRPPPTPPAVLSIPMRQRPPLPAPRGCMVFRRGVSVPTLDCLRRPGSEPSQRRHRPQKGVFAAALRPITQRERARARWNGDPRVSASGRLWTTAGSGRRHRLRKAAVSRRVRRIGRRPPDGFANTAPRGSHRRPAQSRTQRG